jgi:hypothetical protein
MDVQICGCANVQVRESENLKIEELFMGNKIIAQSLIHKITK